jgi:hypothetical protein
MTNARRFNRLALPAEYLLRGARWEPTSERIGDAH